MEYCRKLEVVDWPHRPENKKLTVDTKKFNFNGLNEGQKIYVGHVRKFEKEPGKRVAFGLPLEPISCERDKEWALGDQKYVGQC
ncbi:hypothetical protein FRX31_007723 [Thalictrum thalictroides]|uniref:Uncharacterized protein n=1 Tax=Thalictrum thalictroides TaxID=46969 RepID=A0A7J6WZ02_THATH|nr:hypothetical protein FRX31_007723 [Thalictrum thalictroides]